MLSLKKQIFLIQDFLSHEEFQGSAIINDNRMLPVITQDDYLISKIGLLSSLEIYIPVTQQRKIGKWFPGNKNNLFDKYKKLSTYGLILDIQVIDINKYNLHVSESLFYCGLNISLLETENIRGIYDYHKIIHFDIDFKEIIVSYLPVIRNDSDDVVSNLFMYKQLYSDYIFYKKIILKKDNFEHKEKLLKYYIDYRIFEFKNRIKLYQTISDRGYFNLHEVFNTNFDEIREFYYKKDVGAQDFFYRGKICKIYNIESCEFIQKGDILVVQDTNPEFLRAFNFASFVCAETSSELSHAAITCRELNIPLALGCKGLFLSVENGKSIVVNIKNKLITVD